LVRYFPILHFQHLVGNMSMGVGDWTHFDESTVQQVATDTDDLCAFTTHVMCSLHVFDFVEFREDIFRSSS